MTSPEPPEVDETAAGEQVTAGEDPVYQTRSARRAAAAKHQKRARRAGRPPLASPAAGRLGGVPIATILTAVLLALAGYAGNAATGALGDGLLLAIAVAWAGLVIAWGWPGLLGSTSRFGAPLSIAVAALGAAGAVWKTTGEPYLTYVPVALAAALVVMFLHQLLRRDGRGRLTQSVAVTAAGISIAALGSCYVALARFDGGLAVLTVALAAIAAGSLVELLTPVPPLRPWLLPFGMLLGGGAAAAVAAVQNDPATARAVLVGFVVAAVSHALRRVLAPLPAITTLRSQVASGVASVLVSAVVAYALAWAFLR